MNAYVGGRKIALDPALAIGKGGEADIYDISQPGSEPTVLKLFKQADHPDLAGDVHEQRAAKSRLETHQAKLPAFPKTLPWNVVGPKELAYSSPSSKSIVGYTMTYLAKMEPLLRYQERKFRAATPLDCIRDIFLELHKTVAQIHEKKIVIGDFHDLNILVPVTGGHKHEWVYIIDTDSFQFGKYLCSTYTETFVDPMLCDPKSHSPQLVKPHNEGSDWYAYAVMLMRCMLFVGPYGGIYRPANVKDNVPHGQRPMKRITVFRPDVRYPKPAIPYKALSDDMLHEFHKVFEKDQRGAFPDHVIAEVRWTTCSKCGTEHARATCPDCKPTPAAAVTSTTTVRGKVTVSTIFKPRTGRVVQATVQGGKVLYLYHDGNEYLREGGRSVLNAQLLPKLSFRIRGDETVIAENGGLLIFKPGQTFQQAQHLIVDSFDTNADHIYWVSMGQLNRDGDIAQVFIGDVLRGQTHFWVGPKFGFGFYRAGGLSVAFVFGAHRQGINDTVKFPRIAGQLVDATCVFSDTHAWSFQTIKAGAKTINRCLMIKEDGSIVATAEEEQGNGTWLGTIRGKTAAGNLLFAATDDGVVRVDLIGSTNKTFPDTEPFVDSETRLLVTGQGLVSVSPTEISLIKMTP